MKDETKQTEKQVHIFQKKILIIEERVPVPQMRKSKTVSYHAVTAWTLENEVFYRN